MNKLTVSSSPHVRSAETTTRIMLDVIIALLPALVAATVLFGTRALVLSATCVITSVVAEFICRKVMKRDNTLGDLSAIVTGLILSFNLPATVPLWIAAIGSIFAIVVVKQMFGGIGQNFVNPAMTARIVLMVSFPVAMARCINPFENAWSADAITSATPMAVLNGGDGELPSLLDMFLGAHGGAMGEVSAAALLLGGLYLIVRRVISPAIPVSFIGTVALLTLVAGKGDIEFMLYHILGGGLFLGAFFMATDYVTCPLTFKGRIVFGIGCGVITSVIRLFGSLPEGVSFSIILMNIFVPYIERLTTPRPFGTSKAKKEGKA